MKIGILGGGQLSQMLALAGIPLGLDFVFYEPQKQTSVALFANVINGAYADLAQIDQFLKQVDVVTFENENIPLATLNHITANHVLHPSKEALLATQDRLLEKQLFQQLHIPTNRFQAINSVTELTACIEEFSLPLVVKKRRHGYDGRGQFILRDHTQLKQLNDQACQDCIVEEFIAYDREVSVIAARSQNQFVVYDLNQNCHKQGILFQTQNVINDPLLTKASDHIKKLMDHFNYYGICTIEFFVKGQQLIANEVAPRVHNSGHWTIEGALTSQFENHLRAILNWPLGSTQSLNLVTMFNLISDLQSLETLKIFNDIALHLYHKSPRLMRKLGHVTLPSNSANLENVAELLVEKFR